MRGGGVEYNVVIKFLIDCLDAFAKLRKTTTSFVMSVSLPVYMEQLCSPRQIFMKFDIWEFFFVGQE